MMLLALATIAIATSSGGSGSGSLPNGTMILNFADTDVAQVFRMIGQRTGTNVVYCGPRSAPERPAPASEKGGAPGAAPAGGEPVAAGGDFKNRITLHLIVHNVEEAIRGAAAAAGLTYRRLGSVYIVAEASDMRRALAPYAVTDRIDAMGDAAALASTIQKTLPDLDVRPAFDRIYLKGLPDDVETAKELARFSRERADHDAASTQYLTLKSMPAQKVSEVLNALMPTVKTVILSDQTGVGGTIALIGSAGDVAAARVKGQELDGAVPDNPITVVSYDARYGDATTLKDFVNKAVPSVEAIVAPLPFMPAKVNLPSTMMTGAGDVSGSSGGGAGSSGMGTSAGTTTTTTGPNAGSGSTTATTGSSGARRLILKGRKDDVDLALQMLADADTKPPQVMVEVRVVDTSPTALEQSGINWTWSPLQFFESPAGTGLTGSGIADTTSYTPGSTTTRPAGLGALSRAPLNFFGVLNALIKKQEAKVLASPSVQVIDNQEATIFVGDKLYYQLAQSGALGSQTTALQQFSVGISLAIRPRINADGNITLSVNPTVSTLTGTSDNLPQIGDREAQTTVIVKDGETMVIGGLIRDQEVKTVQEVPLLSRLPLVGQLFRSSSTSKDHSNVIVMITPHLIKDGPPEPSK